ncbi:MAG: hypothetical protein LBC49_02655, partial [Bacteroidales bacterium]|nr:hypothetical protein [Bacteroidales bacterium]
KNKTGLSLIISGTALMLLTVGAFFLLKKDAADLAFFSFGVPENSFVEDVAFEITDAAEFIDDTVFIEKEEDIVEEKLPSGTFAIPARSVNSASANSANSASSTNPANAAKQKKQKVKTSNIKTEASVAQDQYGVQQSSDQNQSTNQKSSRAAFTNNFTIGGTEIKVEFWNPDKNFKGYHLSLSQKKLLLFGIKQFDPLRFEKYGESQILMYHKDIPYLLEEKLDIEPLQKFSFE